MEGQTLTGILKGAAEKFPDRVAVAVSGYPELTHAQLHRLVEDAAGHLLSSGVLPGDVVALCFPNSIQFVVAFLAVIRARAVAAPLNGAYTEEEFVFYLSDSRSKLLISSNISAKAAAIKLGIPHATEPVQIGTGSNPRPPANEPSDVALFLHTSGTTNRPKGVPLTQLNLASSVANIRSVYRLGERDSTVIVLPLFHVHGLIAGLLSSLAAGAAVSLPRVGRFSASTFWAEMRACGATWYTAVPTVHQILLDLHEARPEPAYPKLRFIRSCSAALAPVILERLEAVFGAPVLESYAMTEAAHLMASNPLPEDGSRKPGSVGRPGPGVEMTVLSEEGERKRAGEQGEVCVRGPNVTKGYTGNPEANAEAFRFGWFHTGDLGFLDSDGYLHLVGRIKELINRGGEKISPLEVDEVLLSVPGVSQAVAFGVPDDKYGEEVKERERERESRERKRLLSCSWVIFSQINCAVVPREGAEVEESAVIGYCKKNLAAFKVPKKVFVGDSLPRTATGKIQRRIAAEHFLSKISTAKAPKFAA